jgi:hypothetical protein
VLPPFFPTGFETRWQLRCQGRVHARLGCCAGISGQRRALRVWSRAFPIPTEWRNLDDCLNLRLALAQLARHWASKSNLIRTRSSRAGALGDRRYARLMGRWAWLVWVLGFALACGGQSQEKRAQQSDGSDSGTAGSASGSGGTDVAGRGGSAGVAAGAGGMVAGGSGGLAGRGGTTSGGSSGADDCPATTSDFCESVSFSACPETRGGAWYPGSICSLDAEGAVYSECSDGSVRFSWSVAGENDYELVFVNGELTYGSSNTYPDSSCRVGSRPAAGDCEGCDFCPGNLGGAGASGASGEACDFLSDGRIALPR